MSKDKRAALVTSRNKLGMSCRMVRLSLFRGIAPVLFIKEIIGSSSEKYSNF